MSEFGIGSYQLWIHNIAVWYFNCPFQDVLESDGTFSKIVESLKFEHMQNFITSYGDSTSLRKVRNVGISTCALKPSRAVLHQSSNSFIASLTALLFLTFLGLLPGPAWDLFWCCLFTPKGSQNPSGATTFTLNRDIG